VQRLFFWLGDKNWVVRFPGRVFGSMFGVLWAVGTLIFHYVPKWYGDGPPPGHTLSWNAAFLEGLVIAIAGTSISLWLSRR
jgi:hypothetical protein